MIKDFLYFDINKVVSIQDWTVTMETNVKFDIQRTIHKKMFSTLLSVVKY